MDLIIKIDEKLKQIFAVGISKSIDNKRKSFFNEFSKKLESFSFQHGSKLTNCFTKNIEIYKIINSKSNLNNLIKSYFILCNYINEILKEPRNSYVKL